MSSEKERENKSGIDSTDARDSESNLYSGTRCLAPWCCYCGFTFRLGDELRLKHKNDDPVIVTKTALNSRRKPGIVVERTAAPQGRSRKALTFCTCSLTPRCLYGFSRVLPSCHESCFHTDQYVVNYLNSWNIRRPNFKPIASHDAQRAIFFLDEVVSLLSQVAPSLPMEIYDQIMSYCLHEYAASHLITGIRQQTQEKESNDFDLTKNVWARHVEFEGQRYIQSLFNEGGCTPAEGDELILGAEEGRSVSLIFVETSSVGIRRVLFGDHAARPVAEEQQDVWWKVMHVQQQKIFTSKMDGIKLRQVVAKTNRQGFYTDGISEVLWPTPARYYHHRLITDRLQNSPLYFGKHISTKCPRMKSLDLDNPQISGLSFAFKDRGWHHPILTIHAHTPGENFVLYQTLDSRERGFVSWLYVPLGPGEKITEIWAKNVEKHIPHNNQYSTHLKKWVLNSDDTSVCEYWLLIITNKGQVHRIGSARSDTSQEWKLVNKSPEGLKRLFFEDPDDIQLGIWNLGFRQEDCRRGSPVHTQPLEPLRTHHTHEKNFSSDLPRYMVFCNAVRLDNVAEIIVCQRNPNKWYVEESFVSGLLLRYEDGHEERVGEIRLDSLKKPLKVVDSSHVLHLDFDERVVTSCTLGPAKIDTDLVEVPLTGILEWCFSVEKTFIHHNGELVLPLFEEGGDENEDEDEDEA